MQGDAWRGAEGNGWLGGLDAAGENGLAYGVTGEGELVWQQVSFGSWNGWLSLRPTHQSA